MSHRETQVAMQSQRPDHATTAASSDPWPQEETTIPNSAASPNFASSKRRRLATVYDAVAGKVSYEQALWEIDHTAPKHGQGGNFAANSSFNKPTPLPPDEVLFRRRNAPERYAEHDVYFANERNLPAAGQGVLPDSDLLTAVHGYASKFYEAVRRQESLPIVTPGRTVDERSMDETALLAFGILLEEAGREVLGRRGDLVFTEEADELEASDEDASKDATTQSSVSRARSTSTSIAKRRRLATP